MKFDVFESEPNIREYLLALVIIAVVVSIFNYEAVFGLDVFILDDNSRIIDALKGNFFNDYFRNMGIGISLLKFLNYKLILMGGDVARLFYLLVFMIPLSFACYIFNRACVKMDFIPSVFISVMINILPYQLHIPKFIDGSYSLVGALFLFISLIFASIYLDKGRNVNLILAGFFWIVTNLTFFEMTIFIFPSIVLLFFFRKSERRNKIIALSVFTAVILYKIYFITSNDRGPAGSLTIQSLESIVYRFKLFSKWFAFYDIGDTKMTMLPFILTCVLLVVVSIILVIKSKNSELIRNTLYAHLFYLTLGIATTVPFLTVTKFISARYFYTANLALWSALILAFYTVFSRLIKNKNAVFIALTMLVLYSGYLRNMNEHNENKGNNRRFALICNELKTNTDIREDSQIVISGTNVGTGEFYVWSTGYIQNCLRRPDVTGIIGNEYSFYNPLNPAERGYSYKMSGMDIEKPLTLMRMNSGKITYGQFLLQWMDSKDKNSEWTVYRRNNETGLFEKKYAGHGYDEYISMTKENGLDFTEIMWGNPDSKPTRRSFN